MENRTPEWVKHAIFYQIFPDRFARSQRMVHPRGITFKPWGSPPEEQGFQGGDLLGIIDKLDYIEELGANALYLNPIFSSAANHRYHTFDYYRVDPLLGGNAALRELLDAAHARDMHVVLDGVFNHASRGFWPFHHVLETGADSPYVDWFLIDDWPLRPYHSDDDHPANYTAWWNLPALPKLNASNPGVRDFLFDVARYWIDFGIDGWRLDVPHEIDDDTFWRRFRRIVKESNPDAYLCGELWGDASRWLKGDQFDGVMNYPFLSAALSFFGAGTLQKDYKRPNLRLKPIGAPTFSRVINRLLNLYDREVNQVQLNLLDSHDTARARWILGENLGALRLAVLFQMTMPGAPCIYYGDEIGLSSPDDPFCRQAFPWHDEASWDSELLAFYRKATSLRRRYSVLRNGDFRSLYAVRNVFAFSRKKRETEAIVVFNTADRSTQRVINAAEIDSKAFTRVWPAGTGHRHHISRDELVLTLEAREAVVLVNDAYTAS